MQQFLQFVIEHWLLWSLFIVILGLVLWFEMRTNVGGVLKVQPQQVVNLMNHENAVVLDIREEKTFKDGHIINALNISMPQLESSLKKLQKHKNKPLVVVCNQGVSAMKAAASLRKQGFEKVYVLNGGINAWRSANLPLAQKK